SVPSFPPFLRCLPLGLWNDRKKWIGPHAQRRALLLAAIILGGHLLSRDLLGKSVFALDGSHAMLLAGDHMPLLSAALRFSLPLGTFADLQSDAASRRTAI